MKKSKTYILFALMGLLSSCGVFLAKSGMKNYKPKDEILSADLNDYQYDFIYLSNRLEDAFPMIDSVYSEKDRKASQDYLMKYFNEPNLENKDFALNSRRYLSNFNNQHTWLYLKSDIQTYYPFYIHIYNDEWYLKNIATTQDSSLIGKKIIKINGYHSGFLEEKLLNLTFAENKIGKQFQLRWSQLYNRPFILKDLGIIEKLSDDLELTFEDDTVVKLSSELSEKKAPIYKIDYKNRGFTQKVDKTYMYKVDHDNGFGYLQFNDCQDSITVILGIESYVKPWLQSIARSYVKKQYKKKKPSKAVAEYINKEHPSFYKMIWEMVDSLNKNNVDNLIIDLRNNSGGDQILGTQLLYFLTDKNDLKNFKKYIYTSDLYTTYFYSDYVAIKNRMNNNFEKNILVQVNENEGLFEVMKDTSSPFYIPSNRPIYKGNIYVLANYKTGSAAAMLTTLFEDNNIGSIIGTSVGNNATGATSYLPLTMPKTKAKVSIAVSYQERPDTTKGNEQKPDIWVEYSLEDLMNGHDPYFEKVIELINKKN